MASKKTKTEQFKSVKKFISEKDGDVSVIHYYLTDDGEKVLVISDETDTMEVSVEKSEHLLKNNSGFLNVIERCLEHNVQLWVKQLKGNLFTFKMDKYDILLSNDVEAKVMFNNTPEARVLLVDAIRFLNS